MIAIAGFYNGGISGLPVAVKAPVVKLLHHLARVDILIKAAGGVGTGIGRISVGQFPKTLFRGVAGFPLLIDALGFRLRIGPGGLFVGFLHSGILYRGAFL